MSNESSPELQRLAAASRQLVLGAEEAERAFGPPRPEGADDIDQWAHDAQWELSETFEVAWQDSAEEDLQTLDYLASQWGELPEEEALAQMALSWGALLGERVISSVGGRWVFRADPLHHAVHFPRQGIEYFPMHAVLARFLLGPEAGLEAGFDQLVEFLTSS